MYNVWAEAEVFETYTQLALCFEDGDCCHHRHRRWLYLSVRVLVSLKSSIHSSLFIAGDHQRVIVPNILAFFPTSLQRLFGLPVFRCSVGFTYIIFLGNASSFILQTYPAHLSLAVPGYTFIGSILFAGLMRQYRRLNGRADTDKVRQCLLETAGVMEEYAASSFSCFVVNDQTNLMFVCKKQTNGIYDIQSNTVYFYYYYVFRHICAMLRESTHQV